MPMYFFLWTDEFLAKIEERGIAVDEVMDVVQGAAFVSTSDSSGLPLVKGYSETGRYLIVVFEWADDEGTTVIPVTAFTPDKD
ncbi:MAG: DUF4258 domain-containing protein [Planctomycetaceae bacterium]|nr:DUF4258 domain-containing protein [Planctomycetaceae bacterium]